VNAKPAEPPGPAKVISNPSEASTTNAATSKVESTPPMTSGQLPPEGPP
jgi:hypothetical protein